MPSPNEPYQVETLLKNVDVSSDGLLHSDPRNNPDNRSGKPDTYRDIKIVWLFKGPRGTSTREPIGHRFSSSVVIRAYGLNPPEDHDDKVDNMNEFKSLSNRKRQGVRDIIRESFTPREAEKLKSYLLKKWSKQKHEKIKLSLPVQGEASLGRILSQSTRNGFDLSESERYDLPFNVKGYYNLSNHEMA